MKEIVKRYFNFLLRPFASHSERDGLPIVEAILISWIFVFIQAFYQVFKIRMGIETAEVFGVSASQWSLFDGKLQLYFTLLGTLFAPLIFWAYIKMWTLFIRFFVFLLDSDVDREIVDSVVSSALVSKFFLVMPIIGPFISNIAYLFYLYAGLRSRLNFTRFQAISTLFSPFVLFATFILLEIVLLVPAVLYFFLGA